MKAMTPCSLSTEPPPLLYTLTARMTGENLHDSKFLARHDLVKV